MENPKRSSNPEQTGTPVILVEDLVKHYGPHLALKGISFELHKGEVLGFLGPNGAGKTTTMRILTCFLAPTSGKVTVAGNNIAENSLAVRQNIGYLPENTPLYLDATVLEFLRFAAALRQVDKTRVSQRIREVSETCGLFEVMGKLVGELSRGYRQRVGLAQALIHDPPVLIFDEPTSGLDPNQIVEIRELIKKIGQEKTVILSTHILPEVQATCSRVVIIHEGKLVADGTPGELSARNTDGTCRVVVDAKETSSEDVSEKIARIAGVSRVSKLDCEEDAIAFLVSTKESLDPRRDLFS
ncbi:MAG: ATP-binding cassette domain-containing protein [Pseudomonadota bacterium]